MEIDWNILLNYCWSFSDSGLRIVNPTTGGQRKPKNPFEESISFDNDTNFQLHGSGYALTFLFGLNNVGLDNNHLTPPSCQARLSSWELELLYCWADQWQQRPGGDDRRRRRRRRRREQEEQWWWHWWLFSDQFPLVDVVLMLVWVISSVITTSLHNIYTNS